MHRERPALLEFGLFLSALHAALWLGLALAGSVLAGLGVGLAGLLHPAALLPVGFIGGLAGVVLGIYIGWCALTLYACHAVWNGSRGWTWVLLFLSLAALTDFGPLSTPARIITVIGIVQWFGARTPQAA